MTDTNEFERISTAWLHEGPDQLADRVLDGALAEIHRTDQRRGPVALWRIPDMSLFMRLAAALAIVAIAAGGGFLALRSQGQVAATASPSTSATVPASSPAGPLAWLGHDSSRYHYSIDYPANWTLVEGTEDWAPHTFPAPGGPAEDRFVSDKDPETWVLVTSDALEPGEQLITRQAKLDQENATVCNMPGQPGGLRNTSTVTLDGVDSRLEDWVCQEYFVLESFVGHGGRVYVIDLASKNESIWRSERAAFDRMLQTFRFR
jgi:hypothetical protein